MEETVHVPVLLNETIDGLNLKQGDVVVDATLGGGGHARAILERILPDGTLIAFDADANVIARFREMIEREVLWKQAVAAGHIILVHRNFSELDATLREIGIEQVSAILADLGFSSDQIENAERGFSFREDGPLDMRLDQEQSMLASTLVNEWTELALRDMFRTYADERFAGKIARAIVVRRDRKRFERTKDLADTIASVVPHKRADIHPATKAFQAIRIAVNDEMGALESFLEASICRLARGGRLAVISFHSGEDRKVKQKFREDARGCICPKDFPVCRCGRLPRIRQVTARPIVASDAEMSRNPRARSAKLRIAERINE